MKVDTQSLDPNFVFVNKLYKSRSWIVIKFGKKNIYFLKLRKFANI